MGNAIHPAATDHLPPFITAPGQTDVLLVVMGFISILGIFLAGVFFFWLHSLPERMVHRSSKLHFDIVAVLALISLFTHIHAFWIAALLLALIDIPKVSQIGVLRPFNRIASALDRIHATITPGFARMNDRAEENTSDSEENSPRVAQAGKLATPPAPVTGVTQPSE